MIERTSLIPFGKHCNRQFWIEVFLLIQITQECICTYLFDTAAELNMGKLCIQECFLLNFRDGLR